MVSDAGRPGDLRRFGRSWGSSGRHYGANCRTIAMALEGEAVPLKRVSLRKEIQCDIIIGCLVVTETLDVGQQGRAPELPAPAICPFAGLETRGY